MQEYRLNKSKSYLVVGIIAFCVFWSSMVVAGELPADTRMKILLRILTYDRQVNSRADDNSFTIVVLHNSNNPSSVEESKSVITALKSLSGLTLKGLDLKFVSTPYKGNDSINNATQKRIGAVYICTGLQEKLVDILAFTGQKKIASMSGDLDLVKKGVAIGAIEQNGKGQIVINLKSAKNEGLDLDASLLRIANVIR